VLRTLVAGGVAVLLGSAVLAPTGIAAAAGPDREEVEQRQEQVERGLEQSREDLAHVNSALVAASQRLEQLRGQLPAARQAVADAEAEAEAARQRDAELAVELELAEAAVVAAGLELDQRTSEADETEKVVAGVARDVYQGSGFTPLTILVEANSASEYADMISFAGIARRSQEQALSRLRVQQSDIRNAEARLEAERVRVDDLKALAAEQVLVTQAAEQAARDAQAELEGLVEAEDQAVKAFAAAKAAEEADIRALQAEESELERQLAAIAEAERQAELERQRQAEAERQRQAELERQRQAEIRRQQEEAARNNRPPPPPPAPVPAPPAYQAPAGNGQLLRPTDTRITSSFGYRIHPILGYNRLHSGTDFGGPCGVPVRAAADGTIVSAGWGGGYGNLTVITHGNGLATAYAHLSSYAVTSGSVSRGQVIGYIGTTGSSTGCHLHFEVRVSGIAVDPMGYL
jgi:murein DD-endopeptidase MepM/ murein hydrolase activator NlpD